MDNCESRYYIHQLVSAQSKKNKNQRWLLCWPSLNVAVVNFRVSSSIAWLFVVLSKLPTPGLFFISGRLAVKSLGAEPGTRGFEAQLRAAYSVLTLDIIYDLYPPGTHNPTARKRFTHV